MEWVLESGPWLADNACLVLLKWSLDLASERLSLSKLLVWVRLGHIPLAYYHREGITILQVGLEGPYTWTELRRMTQNLTTRRSVWRLKQALVYLINSDWNQR